MSVCAWAASAAATGAAVNDTPKEEVVYARLSAAGAVDNVYVVNVLKPNAPGTVVDYGPYTAVQNLTDRHHGMRLVIEVKNGFNPEAVLAQLYKFTPLEDSFGINNVALVDGQPRTLGLKELLQVFLDHRIEVVRRRSEFRLNKAQRQARQQRRNDLRLIAHFSDGKQTKVPHLRHLLTK